MGVNSYKDNNYYKCRYYKQRRNLTHQTEVYGGDEFVDVVIEVVVAKDKQCLLNEASLTQWVYEIPEVVDATMNLYNDHYRVVAWP